MKPGLRHRLCRLFHLSRLFGLAALLGATAGCDYFALQELRPGVSTAREVQERFGNPAMEWRNDDGSLTWEYPRGPQGVDTYMITLGPDRVLRSIEQVLTEAHYARIEPGMDEAQVRRILGRPGSINRYPAKPETVWDWRIAGPAVATEEWHFHVHFGPDGKVAGTSRRQEIKG